MGTQAIKPKLCSTDCPASSAPAPLWKLELGFGQALCANPLGPANGHGHRHRCEPCPDFIQHMGNWADVSVKRDGWKKTARYYIFFLPITCSWCSSALDVSWPPVPRDVKELIMKTLSRLQTRLVQTNWFLLDFVMCTSATSTKWTTILHCMVTQASIFSTDRYTGTTNCIEPLWKLDHWKRSADIKGYIVAFFLFKKSG